MRKVLIALFALFGVFLLVASLVAIGLGLLAAATAEHVPSRVILELDFESGVVEAVPDDPLARLMQDRVPQLLDVVDAVDRAAADRHVVGLFARVGGAGIGLAHLQEVRDAVARFRESGKPTLVFAESFGEFGPGNGGYYLASAFETVYLQPSGNLGLTGLMYESPFVRGLLDKIDVRPDIGQRHEYKNAVNFYTERAFTEPHRRALQELMESQFAQITRGIAAARGLEEQHVRGLFDAGPYIGAAAVDAELVDALGYRDEALDALRAAAEQPDVETVGVGTYLRHAGRPNRRGETIALIHGHGAVMSGRSAYSPVDGSVTMGSDTIAEAFQDAVEDPRVRAIVFRVDSPGGSFVASDTIWRETVLARRAKPVIVSMGNLAGSGGYYVAMHADKIVAQPGTITASIGVYGGKMYTREFWERLGVTWDDVHTSEHSRMWSAHYGWEESGGSFDAMLDRVYEVFTTKVAEDRGLALEKVQEIARGRIWTGEDALALGLVDELGGLDVALRLAREAVGLAPDAAIRLKRFPRPRSALELLLQRGETEGAALAAAARALRAMQPAAQVLTRLGLGGPDGVLVVPDAPTAH